MSGEPSETARNAAQRETSAVWRGGAAQRIRLVSGLVLFAYSAGHFVNHALGLVSLDAMETFDRVRTVVNRSDAGAAALLAALLAHAGLGLWELVRRRNWALPPWQWLQALSGIAIPLLLIPHMVNTRLASELFGVRPTYAYELAHIWPTTVIQQSVLLLLVWVHGCVGLHYWLRLARGYERFLPWLFALAVLVPFAAIAGVSVQGRAVQTALADPAVAARLHTETNWPGPEDKQAIDAISERARLTYVALLLAAAGAAGLGVAAVRRSRRIPVHYVGGPRVLAEPGSTILEISRRANVPHTSICGGRGRCSTCRILVLDGGAGVAPPKEAERRTLRAIGAGRDVRLACQTIPIGRTIILPLVKEAPGRAAFAAGTEREPDGREQDLAVLFVDLRGFTALTERMLPFDVIYILNQFFGTVARVVQEQDGWVANTAGDGVITLFASEAGVATASRSALLAAAGIDQAMEELGRRLAQETRTPLRVAMGLHAGPHVLGRLGFGGAGQPTSAIGLAMNVTSRLEGLAKQADVQLALSGTVASLAGLQTTGLRAEAIDVRGLGRPLEVVFVPAARDLLPRLGQRGAAEVAAIGLP